MVPITNAFCFCLLSFSSSTSAETQDNLPEPLDLLLAPEAAEAEQVVAEAEQVDQEAEQEAEIEQVVY